MKIEIDLPRDEYLSIKAGSMNTRIIHKAVYDAIQNDGVSLLQLTEELEELAEKRMGKNKGVY